MKESLSQKLKRLEMAIDLCDRAAGANPDYDSTMFAFLSEQRRRLLGEVQAEAVRLEAKDETPEQDQDQGQKQQLQSLRNKLVQLADAISDKLIQLADELRKLEEQ